MSRAFAASDVQSLKGIQLLLSLVLAFWFRIRVRDIPAPSSKVKKMSGTSAFLQRSCWAEFNRKIPVSTSSKTKACDFESLTRGQDKNFLNQGIYFRKQFFVYLLPEWINLVVGILWRLIFWKILLCNWLANQTFVGHRSRNEDKLLHIKTNGKWREE